MKCRQGLPDTIQGPSGAKSCGGGGPRLDVPHEVHSRERDRQLRHKVIRARYCPDRAIVGGFLEDVILSWSVTRAIHSASICHTPTLGTVLYSPG